jgi:cell division protein FtsW (lipid II flippase)
MLAAGVLMVWLLLGVIAAAGVAWWARRLWTKREELSLGAKALAALVALILIVAALGTVASIAKAFIAVDGEAVDPSEKARLVAEGISAAMNLTSLGIATALVGAVILRLIRSRA